MLSDRRQRVLAALIEEYVARALPVGSRTLTERYQLGVSPATVRNELSILEDEGYIAQPHTSAGRIPTDFGYRTFVDELLSNESLPDEKRYRAVAENLRKSASELDSLLEQTSSALARLTDCLSIVLAPTVLETRIKQITLVSLNDFRAICVVVTEDGNVFNRQMEFTIPVGGDELSRIQALLGRALCGKSLTDVEQGLSLGMRSAFSDPLVRAVLEEVVSCIQEGQTGRTHRLGMSALLAQPEFSRTDAVLPLMQVLEDDTVLLHILDDVTSTEDLSVQIGKENKTEGLSGVSVVASRYGRGEAQGVVAVIGPTRMEYSKVIQAVRAASAALGES